MSTGPGAQPAPWAPDQLVALALARPTEALAAARQVLAGRPTAGHAAAAHHAAGIVLRDFGDIARSLAHLTSGLRQARAADDPDREVDLLGTLGVARVLAGRTAAGLRDLDRAVALTSGPAQARALVRRSHVTWLIGDHTRARRDAHRAVQLLTSTADPAWLARAVNHRATAAFALGDLRAAMRDLTRCEELFAAAGQSLEVAFARQERAMVTFAAGDLPGALVHLDEAQAGFDELDVLEPDLVVNRCTVLLAAGLAGDALREADTALARIAHQTGSAPRRAELLYAGALAQAADGHPVPSAERSRQALDLFRRQRRPWWAARAEFALLESTFSAGLDEPASLLRAARRVAAKLTLLDPDRAVDAHLLAARIALGSGRRSVAEAHLRTAQRARRGARIRTRSTGWLARALWCEAQGRPREMVAACDRGLDLLDLYLRTLGATELRTLATAHGGQLAALALREAVRRGDARAVLTRSERWRAVALTLTPRRTDPDDPLIGELAALRGLTSRLEWGSDREQRTRLEHERRHLEAAVRRRVLGGPGEAIRPPPVTTSPVAGSTVAGSTVAGSTVAGSTFAGSTVGTATAEEDGADRVWPRRRFEVRELLAALGEHRLLELVEVDDELHVVVVGAGRLALHRVGPAGEAQRAVEHALFTLRRAAAVPTAPAGGPAGSWSGVGPVGVRLEAALLGPAAQGLGPGPVIIVPTGRFQAVPWNLLPALRGRSVSVNPSAAGWLRASRTVPPAQRRVVLVGGPGLTTGQQEVRRLAREYPDAQLLLGQDATADRVLAAIDGAWLVHVAAHGSYRADSPLFSCLHLSDGPLTVYDLERLGRAPHRVVLASCSSAVGAPVGADELLGIVAALTALGSSGVVASVVPVDDHASVPLMLALHRQLRAGKSLAAALALARGSAAGDPAAAATADAFIALGS